MGEYAGKHFDPSCVDAFLAQEATVHAVHQTGSGQKLVNPCHVESRSPAPAKASAQPEVVRVE
jgi:hypothetical protein